MSLEDKLAAMREGAAKRLPPDVKATMDSATTRLRESGILDGVVKPGAPAPGFTLDDQDGRPVDLAMLVAQGPVVLSVFRGFW